MNSYQENVTILTPYYLGQDTITITRLPTVYTCDIVELWKREKMYD